MSLLCIELTYPTGADSDGCLTPIFGDLVQTTGADCIVCGCRSSDADSLDAADSEVEAGREVIAEAPDFADVPDAVSLFKGRRYLGSILFKEEVDLLTIKLFAAGNAVLQRLEDLCRPHFDRLFGTARTQ